MYRLLFLLPAERAHNIAIWALGLSLWRVSLLAKLFAWLFASKAANLNWLQRLEAKHRLSLKTSISGLDFRHPIGLAAGFDKDGAALNGLMQLGFSGIEVGSVTPLAQSGNPKPRLFRLGEDQAIINRMGFNNDGMTAMKQRFAALNQSLKAGDPRPIIGINLGKNKQTEHHSADYCLGAQMLGGDADYITINVSSPNTQGLRALQDVAPMREILSTVRKIMDENGAMIPLFIKLAPDLDKDQLKQIAAMLIDSRNSGAKLANAVIMGNTTLSRPDSLLSPHAGEQGGLSGKPLTPLALAQTKLLYHYLGKDIPIIGCGGIASGHDLYQTLRAGASCVQIYSAFIYQGPALIDRMLAEFAELMAADGFTSIQQLIGIDSINPKHARNE